MNQPSSSVVVAPVPFVDGSVVAAPSAAHRLGLRFTGSGSEYFRIWIVNLLLTLATFGLYYPFAKVRRLRYFYSNTLVDRHALGFHADPHTMVRGYLLVGLMFGLYAVAGRVSPGAQAAAFLIIAAVWPALFKSSLRFRLANTSWRGLRFRFAGTTAGAYRVLLPLLVPLAVLLAGLLALLAFGGNRAAPWFALLEPVTMLTAMLLVPWLWWKLKKYQHDHYTLGSLRTGLQARPGSFYVLFLKTGGVLLLTAAGLGAFVALAVPAGLSSAGPAPRDAALGPSDVVGAAIVAPLAILLVLRAVAGSYFTARFQNLLWSRTGAAGLKFGSTLGFGPLCALTLKNWLLLVLTLGLYWPFAAVAMARLRLEAVTVDLGTEVQTLVDEARVAAGEAAGDAAGDLFGLDVGL